MYSVNYNNVFIKWDKKIKFATMFASLQSLKSLEINFKAIFSPKISNYFFYSRNPSKGIKKHL